ncbi:Hypothetical predicted protein [Mytilus galloprovincialis]|uniref:WSC domain-containing protein n=1 Tax=Mytilus galloprovincialis TaxID=29158 RepID=A0A8B6E3J2_MYTGA|nr:Hypothetical predicted protein [Mytilus galloprovincialis]
MNDIMQLYIWFILISVSGCSVFIGFPKSSWTTSSHVCSLPVKDEINTTDIFMSLNSTDYKEVKKAWTGTVIKHTRWAAFIGCGRSLSSMDSGRSVKTAEDCLKHCSDLSSATNFFIKSSTCYCLSYKPDINGDINDCRGNCTNAIYTPCSSGRSALVFTFIEGLNIEPANKFIEKECLTTTKDNSKFTVSDCNAQNSYGCKHTSRKLTGKESCVAMNKTKFLTFENCESQFPFLCLGKQKTNTIDKSTPNNRYPRFIKLPLGVVVAGGMFIFLLMMIIIFLSCKLSLSKDTAQVKNDLSVDNTWI